MSKKSYAQAIEFKEKDVYYPETRPGYTAWVSLFPFGNGDLGLAFSEIRRSENPDFNPAPLEFVESMNLTYREVPDLLPGCNPDLIGEYVNMKSTDGGKSWQETGRCAVHTRHYWHTGFPDGRLVRIIGSQHYRYEVGKERLCSVIEESYDGGNTWKEISRFIEDKFCYVHKIKRLTNNSIIAVTHIHSSFGFEAERQTRNEQLPGEIKPNQSAFLISEDGGYSWDGPHYILPGIEAWEPDFVELPDGALLFINSTVQGGRAVRQIVRKSSTGWVNGPLMEIHRGAPDDWEKNKQGGFTPESVTMTPAGLIVGARRGGVYSCSNDLGENWYEIEGPAKCNYQPIIENLPDGKFLAVWHYGGDTRFGEIDMFIGTHEFELEANLSLPVPTVLTLERELSEDGTQYINSFSARLTADGEAVAGREIQLQVRDVWVFDPKRRMNPVNVWDSPDIRTGITNSGGVVRFELEDKVRIPDIHHCYQVGVSFVPASGEKLAGCKGPVRPAYSLTQARNNPAPYPIYNLSGRIMITPATAEKFPDLVDIVKHFCVPDPSAGIDTWIKASGSEKRAREVLGFLMKHYIVHSDENDIYHWYRAIGSIPGPEELKPGMQYIHGVEVCTLEEYCV